jgi:hypothetical protein
MAQTVEELANQVELPHFVTKEMVGFLKHDLLVAMYRSKPQVERPEAPVKPEKPEDATDEAENRIYYEELKEYKKDYKAYQAAFKAAEAQEQFNIELNQRISDLYKKRYGKKFDYEIHSKNKKLPFWLMGIPGQGKTAAYFAAGKENAADLDLNFVSHVSDNYVPKMNDLVIIVQECAGENSAITFGGIPRAEEIVINGKRESVLKKALNYRFAITSMVAGAIVLFDDAANAATVIQNVLLPVAQNSTFQGMHIPNALIGFTGNLGSADGTYTNEQSSALLSRVIPVYVTDTLEDWLARGYEQYNDEAGMYGFNAFMNRKPENFCTVPNPGDKHGHASSRSHDNFVQKVRSTVEMYGGRGVGEKLALGEIHRYAISCYGPTMGMEVVSFYNSYFEGADPLAKLFVYDGKPDDAEFKKAYEGGASEKAISFGFQFANACGDYAVQWLLKQDDYVKALPEAMKRFGNAVLKVNDSEFSYALNHLKTALAATITDFAEKTDKTNKEGRELNNEVREMIAHAISALPDCGKAKRSILVKTITDFDRMENNSIHENENKTGPRKNMVAPGK